MDIKNNNQKGSVNVWPEKLYTQREVDNLHKSWENSQSFPPREIKKETQTADKQKVLMIELLPIWLKNPTQYW